MTAASQMIAETGDNSTLTLRGLAQRVGIAAPSIDRHFTDVEDLKMAVVERSFADFARARDAATLAGDDPHWLAAEVWAALHGLVLLPMNAPASPGPGRWRKWPTRPWPASSACKPPLSRHPA